MSISRQTSPASAAAKRTPFAPRGAAFTPTANDDDVIVAKDGVVILREAKARSLIGTDPREQDVFWQGFQRVLDAPAPKVRWQAKPGLLDRMAAALLRLFVGGAR